MSLLMDALNQTKKQGQAQAKSSVLLNQNKSGMSMVVRALVLLAIAISIFSGMYHFRSSLPSFSKPTELSSVPVIPVEQATPVVAASSEKVVGSMSIKHSAHPAADETMAITEVEKNQYYKTLIQAEELLKVHQYHQALPMLTNDTMIEKTNGQSAVDVVRVYLILEQYLQAETYARHAMTFKTKNQIILTGLLGQALFSLEKYQEVLSVLNEEGPSIKKHPSYYALMARSYMKLDQPKKAISLFIQLLQVRQNDINWLIGLALAYQEDGQFESAYKVLQAARKVGSDNPQINLFIEQQLALLKAI